MKLTYFLGFVFTLLLFSCSNKKDKWKVERLADDKVKVEYRNVSESFYDLSLSNSALKEQYPELFANSNDSILSASRKDTVSQNLNRQVKKKFGDLTSVQGDIDLIFQYVNYYYPRVKSAVVYSFTGELEYPNPTVFNPEKNHLAIGLDWFMGSDFPYYVKAKVPIYYRQNMNPENLPCAIVEGISDQIVYDLGYRKFVEQMLVAGKKLVLQDALVPAQPDYLKIGYTPDQLNFAKEHEEEIYTYFSENELFFSDDKKLKERFIDKAPFSKFYGDDDSKTPGRLGAWMGWQIARSYLEKHPEIDLVDFIADKDLQKIFSESGYKP